MNTLLTLGVIFLSALVLAKVVDKIKLPSVTAYLLLGLLIGYSFFNIIPNELIKATDLISNIALGFIAFSIGRNFSFDTFKRIGKSIMWISILEASGAWLTVTILFFLLLKQPIYISLLFGAISAATAPAATVMVVREYKARGNFTNVLLGVVAIDDAWCLIIFSISLAVAKALNIPGVNPHLIRVIFSSIKEIFGALILGGIVAFIMSVLIKHIRTQTEFLIYTLGFVLLNTGLAILLHFSVLLSNMFLGTVIININRTSDKFFDTLSSIDSPIYLLFFVLAGANFELSALKNIGLLGICYIIFRVSGKALGGFLGGQISQAPENVKKYIGLGLIPQAGVALGCALIAKANFPSVGRFVFNTIVATTIIYEIIGPICTKLALQKAGDIPTFVSKPIEQKNI